MKGMDRNTGHLLSGIEHLHQSITDLLTTPIGSRLMQRTYGSRLYELVDAPINRNTLVEIYMAVAQALNRWEKRFKLHQVQVTHIEPGCVQISLVGEYRPNGQIMRLEGFSL